MPDKVHEPSVQKLPSFNPFPKGTSIAYEIWADRTHAFGRLKRDFDAAFSTSEPLVIQVNGEYGSGKTHTLKHFQSLMLQGWDKTRVRPVYMDSPGFSLLDFYNRFLSAIQMETVIGALVQMRASVLVSRSAELAKSFAEGKATERVVEDAFSQGSVFQKVKDSILDIFKEMKPINAEPQVPDFWNHLATALAYLIMGPDETFIATKWLTFQRLYKSELELIHRDDRTFTPYKDDPSYIAYCMAGILSLVCRQMKYDKIVLFIDELEAITESDEKNAMPRLAECLRHLIDSGFPGLVVVLGFTSSAQAVFTQRTALLQRIHSTVVLNPLTPEEAVEFVHEFLEKSGTKVSKDLFPDDAVKSMSKAVGGGVRQFIQVLHIAYDIALESKPPKFTVEDAKRAIAEAKESGIVSS